MDTKLQKLNALVEQLATTEQKRKQNLDRLKELYGALQIDQKVEDFSKLFEFKAINVTGLTLQKEQLCQTQPNRYAQIIGIREGKNINLRYFGRAENLPKNILHDICEFVLRWRLEKNYMNVEHYKELLNGLAARKVE